MTDVSRDELMRLIMEAYGDEKNKVERSKRLFSDDFDIPYSTVRSWCVESRPRPPWIRRVLEMKIKLMEYENENSKPGGAGS